MIIGMGYERYFMFYGASLFTLKIILNVILIPDYDYIGVSIASLITEFILMVVLILFLSKKVAYPCAKSILVVVFSTFFAWLISNYVTDLSYLQFLLGFFIYFTLVFVLGGITTEGLNSVRRLLK